MARIARQAREAPTAISNRIDTAGVVDTRAANRPLSVRRAPTEAAAIWLACSRQPTASMRKSRHHLGLPPGHRQRRDHRHGALPPRADDQRGSRPQHDRPIIKSGPSAQRPSARGEDQERSCRRPERTPIETVLRAPFPDAALGSAAVVMRRCFRGRRSARLLAATTGRWDVRLCARSRD
jgi:hypothetical protein